MGRSTILSTLGHKTFTTSRDDILPVKWFTNDGGYNNNNNNNNNREVVKGAGSREEAE